MDSYLHLHRVQFVSQLQLVGDLVNRREAPAELVTDLLQGPRHLGGVHGGVHPDSSIPATSSVLTLNPEIFISSPLTSCAEQGKILLLQG